MWILAIMKAYFKSFLLVQEPSSYVIPGGVTNRENLYADEWQLMLHTIQTETVDWGINSSTLLISPALSYSYIYILSCVNDY